SLTPRSEAAATGRRLVRAAAGDPVHPAARRGGRDAVLRADHLDGGGPGRAVLLRAHVRRDGGVPPVLRAPLVQDEPVVPVRARVDRLLGDAEGSAVVGGSPPRA